MVHCVTRERFVCFYGKGNGLPRVAHDTFLTSPMISSLFILVGWFRNFVFQNCRGEEKS